MPYERLLKSNRIKPHRANQNEIKQLLQLATRDLNTAKRNLDEAPDWAYSIAYNSILQAGRALMFFEGYRPRGSEQHATVVEFVEERLGVFPQRRGAFLSGRNALDMSLRAFYAKQSPSLSMRLLQPPKSGGFATTC